MGKRLLQVLAGLAVLTVLSVLIAVVAAGFDGWDSVAGWLTSPLTAIVAKIVIGGKVLKWVGIAVLAGIAGWQAVRRRARRRSGQPEEPVLAPPVYSAPAEADVTTPASPTPLSPSAPRVR